jgi:hypothetical protein
MWKVRALEWLECDRYARLGAECIGLEWSRARRAEREVSGWKRRALVGAERDVLDICAYIWASPSASTLKKKCCWTR